MDYSQGENDLSLSASKGGHVSEKRFFEEHGKPWVMQYSENLRQEHFSWSIRLPWTTTSLYKR